METLKFIITMTVANTLVALEIALVSGAMGTKRVVWDIWGWMASWAETAIVTAESDNIRLAISTKTFADADPPTPEEPTIILFHERTQQQGVAGNGAIAVEQGMPFGMFPHPISIAADKIFATLDTTGYAAAADAEVTLFLTPRLVSLEEYLDIAETFK